MNANEPIVISGAGISGLLTAALLRQRHPKIPIVVIEKTSKPGGAFTGIRYDDGSYFDFGMRVFYDTGIDEIDSLVHELLPEQEWNVLAENRKDIAGIFWNGRLQQHSPYIDLRHLERAQHDRCVREIDEASRYLPTGEDAESHLKSRFGPTVAAHLNGVIQKLYRESPKNISALATRQPTMDRVLLFDKDRMGPIMQSPELRGRIGYPDQLSLPPLRTSNQRGWYPRHGGIVTLAETLYQKLRRQDVVFHFDASIETLGMVDGRVDNIAVRAGSDPFTLNRVRSLYWNSGWPSLAKLLGIPLSLHKTPIEKLVYIHLRLSEPLHMGPLYHFYCFDKGYNTFRVTNYANYNPNCVSESGYPLCVEYWPQTGDTTSDHIAAALDELKAFGIIAPSCRITFSAQHEATNYYQFFHLANVRAIADARTAIAGQSLKNLTFIGMLASGSEFLLYDVLRDAHTKLE